MILLKLGVLFYCIWVLWSSRTNKWRIWRYFIFSFTNIIFWLFFYCI